MSWYNWDHEVCTGFMTCEDSQGTGQGSRVGCIASLNAFRDSALSSFSLCMGNYK